MILTYHIVQTTLTCLKFKCLLLEKLRMNQVSKFKNYLEIARFFYHL